MNRRRFARHALAAGAAGLTLPAAFAKPTLAHPGAADLPRRRFGGSRPFTQDELAARYAAMDAAAARPVLRRELFDEPVVLESVRLTRNGRKFMVEVRDAEGRPGRAMSNNHQMPYIYPVCVEKVCPYYEGKDARDLDALATGVYNYRSNYKLQNLALWVGVATVEFAIYDLLGRIAGLPVGALISETIHNPEIDVYQANGYRGMSPEESLERIVATQRATGAKAVKFKIGGRMDAPEVPANRTQRLVPMVRAAFDDSVTLYVDANGSYDVPEAIEIGTFLADNGIALYEEPCPIDHYNDWLAIGRAVELPLAGGGAESSLYAFRWMLAEGGFEVAQPDPFYFGGLTRCVRVARMAEAVGVPIVPHISGTDLCYLWLLHYVSAIPNPGPYHEFKGTAPDLPFTCATSTLETQNGVLKVPTGPGSGVEYAADYLADFEAVGPVG